MAHGLTPQVGPRSALIGERTEAIYLFETLESAEDAMAGWLSEELEAIDEISILEVHIQFAEPVESSFEIIHLDHIAPQNITVLCENIENLSSLKSLKSKTDISL